MDTPTMNRFVAHRSLVPVLVITALTLGALSPAARAGTDDAVVAPEAIYNFHPIDAGLATSGQVTPEQVPALAQAGYGLVVNLAVADPERNAEEGFLVAGAGLGYVQIPVVWDTPTLADLELFFAVMDARGDRRTLVHCFANFRASAFTYLYRTLREGVPEAEARADLEMIWSDEAWAEYPQWVAFIEAARAHYAAQG